ncbi:MAG: hypothetical protein ACJAWV_001803 [Flammeovirgaceae bacterium]|jgi:hypothetical protein
MVGRFMLSPDEARRMDSLFWLYLVKSEPEKWIQSQYWEIERSGFLDPAVGFNLSRN